MLDRKRPILASIICYRHNPAADMSATWEVLVELPPKPGRKAVERERFLGTSRVDAMLAAKREHPDLQAR